MTTTGLIFLPSWAPERLPDFAAAADDAGLDELWLWEDCFAHGGVSTAGVALARTQRIAVGIGVLPVPLRNVALTAMETATLARMFPSRLHLGVGHGVLDWMGQVGSRAASPMTLLREYTVALRALLAGETVDVDGRYVSLRDVTLEWPPDPVPSLSIGATGPKTVALAAELTDGVILTDSNDLDDVARVRAVLDGAGPDRRLTVFVLAAQSVAQTAERVASYSAAGADAVILQPGREHDPDSWLGFVTDVLA